MFRIRVRIDPALLRAHAEAVRSGLPGVAYVRLDPKRRMACAAATDRRIMNGHRRPVARLDDVTHRYGATLRSTRSRSTSRAAVWWD